MINYDEALKIAKKVIPNLNYCTEYDKAYVFGHFSGEVQYGGSGSPVAIMKKDGRALSFIGFIASEPGAEQIKTFDI